MLLGAAALLASYLPARRAARVSPVQRARDEGGGEDKALDED
jgi:ABC-type lipoprotein release transport system permease subunit